jgi:AbrB family looped-hinge helix DNA binding protein
LTKSNTYDIMYYMITTVVVNQKGQITIPAFFRNSLNISPDSNLTIMQQDNTLLIRVTDDFFSLRGSVQSTKPYNKKEARKQFIQSLTTKK